MKNKRFLIKISQIFILIDILLLILFNLLVIYAIILIPLL